MGLRQYARHRAMLGLDGGTLRAVQVAIKTGRVVKSITPAGKIKTAREADAEWAASTKADYVPLGGPTASAEGKRPPVNELGAARARREGAVAELAEIDLAVRRGELVRAADIETRLADVFLRCRTRIMGIVSRAREVDPTLTASQVGLLEVLLVEALEELAGPGA